MNPTRPDRSERPSALVLLGLALALAAGGGCDADEPSRLTTNLRSATTEFQPDGLPQGTLMIDAAAEQISVSLSQFPVISGPAGETPGFTYEGWLSYADSVLGTTYVSTGRFRVDVSNSDPTFPRGEASLRYRRDGTFEVVSGGQETGAAAAMPDSVALGSGVTFHIAIEPDPTEHPGTPTPIRLLALGADLPDSAATLDLKVPVDVGLASEGTFDRMEGEVEINTVTGTVTFDFSIMGYFDRSDPGGASDPGLIYQAWFFDAEPFPVFVRIERFNPNLVGDHVLETALFTGDADGDGLPDPLDLDRLLISVEPDGITSQQPTGSGLDTSDSIFPFVIYAAEIPDVRE